MKFFKKSLKVLKNGYKVVFKLDFSILHFQMTVRQYTDKIFFNNCKMAKDYVSIATFPSIKKDCIAVSLPGRVSGETKVFDTYTIFTIYDRKIRKLNRLFKKYCQSIHHKYTPYKLYLIRNDKKCCYYLRNEGSFFEFFGDNSLKEMVMRFEGYINGLDDIKIPVQKKKNLTKIEAARQKMVDSEINRSYDYIKALKKLKK